MLSPGGEGAAMVEVCGGKEGVVVWCGVGTRSVFCAGAVWPEHLGVGELHRDASYRGCLGVDASRGASSPADPGGELSVI